MSPFTIVTVSFAVRTENPSGVSFTTIPETSRPSVRAKLATWNSPAPRRSDRHILQQIIEVGALRTGEIGAEVAAFAEQLVARSTVLREHARPLAALASTRVSACKIPFHFLIRAARSLEAG